MGGAILSTCETIPANNLDHLKAGSYKPCWGCMYTAYKSTKSSKLLQLEARTDGNCMNNVIMANPVALLYRR